jgi:hypothetical protein
MKQDNLNKESLEKLAILNRNYTPIAVHHLNTNEKVYLGSKEERVCRFCGKDERLTTFVNEAHALPEFIGNKKLIAYYECDSCNFNFSVLLETHMANYMSLYHTLGQVKGKKGVPSFQTKQQKSKIKLEEDGLKILESTEDVITKFDEINKTITFEALGPSYRPIAIYKCLTKMALTIMPEEYLDKFKATMSWINEPDHEKSPHDFKSLYALFSIATGSKPFWFVTASLFKRKDDAPDKVPYMFLLLAYGNFTFQIYLPLCPEDKQYSGDKFSMILFPTPADMDEGAPVLKWTKIDCNAKNFVRGEISTMQMSYESMEEVPIKAKSNDLDANADLSL